ncbi:MAG: DMT family transporter [Burkholderiales bacterium]|jgi:S-adenosylmethionine uptake transporter|nr:DMT family transporter [Burkholderiales bacterium]
MQSLWMLVASALFALLGACVKLAAARYHIAEIVLYRGLTGALALAAYAYFTQRPLGTPIPWTHFRRGAVGTAALSLWFFAAATLPLGTATALNYTSSLFLASFVLGAALRARRPVNLPLMLTVAMGFVGVVLLLQPSFGAGQWLSASGGLLSGLLSATAYWYVRDLARQGEPEWRIVFYFSLSVLAIGFAGSLITGFSQHTPGGVLLLAAVGVIALLAQLAMTRAYALGHALLTASLQYSAIVFSAILGVILFADRIALAGWVGMAVIIGSGALATWLAQRRPRARVDDSFSAEIR